MFSATGDAAIILDETRARGVVRVVLVEPHHLVRNGLAWQCAQLACIEVVARCSAFNEVAQVTHALAAHVCLVGPSVSVRSCMDFVSHIRDRALNVGVVVIQSQVDDGRLALLIQVGAEGILDELATEQDLATAIIAAAGNAHERNPTPRQTAPSAGIPFECLSRREQEVLAHTVRGLSNHEIAGALNVSTKTVENHLTRVYGKLGVRSRAEVIARCVPFPRRMRLDTL